MSTTTTTTTEVIEVLHIDGVKISQSRFTENLSPADYEQKVIMTGAVHVELTDNAEGNCYAWMDKTTGKTIDESFHGFLPFSGSPTNLILIVRKVRKSNKTTN